MKERRLALLLVAVGLARALAAAGAADLADELKPRDVRWHVLPPEITRAFVARGSVFYQVGTTPAAETPSVSVNGVLAPGFRPILFDSAERLWCLTGTGRTLYALKGREVLKADARERQRFQGSAFEDSAGRVWFGTDRGVRWLDGQSWHEKELADPRAVELSSPMSELEMVEGESGRVFFWAARDGRVPNGTKGFWTFDGKEWANVTAQKGLPEDGVEAVCPLRAGVVLVNTPGGRLVQLGAGPTDRHAEVARLVRLLESPQWKEREEATESLKKLGAGIALALREEFGTAKGPETRSRIQMVLRAFGQSEANSQPIPNSGWQCRWAGVRPVLRPDRAAEPQWLLVAGEATETKTGQRLERALFLVSERSTQEIEDPMPGINPNTVAAMSDGRGGLWIGLWTGTHGVGLFHWDGRKTAAVSDEAMKGYAEIFGQDAAGRILLGNWTRVAAFRPELDRR